MRLSELMTQSTWSWARGWWELRQQQSSVDALSTSGGSCPGTAWSPCSWLWLHRAWWGVHSDPGPPVVHLIQCPLTVSNLTFSHSRLCKSTPTNFCSLDCHSFGVELLLVQLFTLTLELLWYLRVGRELPRPSGATLVLHCATPEQKTFTGGRDWEFFPHFYEGLFNEDTSYATLSKP